MDMRGTTDHLTTKNVFRRVGPVGLEIETTQTSMNIPVQFCIIDGMGRVRTSKASGILEDFDLEGLEMETSQISIDDAHISYSQPGIRNFVFIWFSLPHGMVKVLGKVEWYERIQCMTGTTFLVRVKFCKFFGNALSLIQGSFRDRKGATPQYKVCAQMP